MSTAKDLTRQKFGEWTVIEKDDTKPRHWICRCSCGNTKSVMDYSLTSGRSLSCGKCGDNHKDKTKLSIGSKFGEWTVISDINNYKVRCRCSCGKEREVNIYTLLSGRSTGCGHTMNQDRVIDLVDRQFGDLKVIKYIGDQKWECKCSCGNTIIAHRNHLIDGRTKSCGHNINKDPIDLTKLKFGKLQPIKYMGNKNWLCQCDCGNQKVIAGANLRNGSTVSCGCIQFTPTLEELVEKINEYKHIYNSTPNAAELASYLKIPYSTLLYHAHKHKLKELGYIDISYSSIGEKEVFSYIKSIYNGKIERCVNNIITPYELDIYLPDLKIAIEYNGSYWHSELNKDAKYHMNKTLACGYKGIRLIHIFEYEWNDNNTQTKIKALLNNVINKSNNILYARNLSIKEIDNNEAIEFCNKYHLQNGIASKINLGLYNKDELVYLMTFGYPRFNNSVDYEILRIVSKNKYNIVGGAEKLFKYFIDKYNPSSIVSYCNLSKFYGEVYTKLGFKANLNELKPNYVWCNLSNDDVLPRYKTMKSNLVAAGLGNEDDTEDDIMHTLGYTKIYDCGNLRFIWKK